MKCSKAATYEYTAQFTRFEIPSQSPRGGIASVAFEIKWRFFCKPGGICPQKRDDPTVRCLEDMEFPGSCKGGFTYRHPVQPGDFFSPRKPCGKALEKWIEANPSCRLDQGFSQDCWNRWAEWARTNMPHCWPNIPFGGSFPNHTPAEFPRDKKAMDKMFPGMSDTLNEKIEDAIKKAKCKCVCTSSSSPLTDDGTSHPPESGELPGPPSQHTTFILPNGRTSK